MVVIGLTGGIASGKSAASKYLKSLGAKVWDADKAARKVVRPGSPGAQAVRAAFGDEFFDAEGNLLRARLGKLVFEDAGKREQLNAIIHPLVTEDLQRTLQRWRREDIKVAVVDAPLLLEAGLETLVDEVWVTSCGSDEQLRRLVERDGLSFDDARKRLAAQMSDVQRRRRAQRIIDTSGRPADTRRALKALYQELEDEHC